MPNEAGLTLSAGERHGLFAFDGENGTAIEAKTTDAERHAVSGLTLRRLERAGLVRYSHITYPASLLYRLTPEGRAARERVVAAGFRPPPRKLTDAQRNGLRMFDDEGRAKVGPVANLQRHIIYSPVAYALQDLGLCTIAADDQDGRREFALDYVCTLTEAGVAERDALRVGR